MEVPFKEGKTAYNHKLKDDSGNEPKDLPSLFKEKKGKLPSCKKAHHA